MASTRRSLKRTTKRPAFSYRDLSGSDYSESDLTLPLTKRTRSSRPRTFHEDRIESQSSNIHGAGAVVDKSRPLRPARTSKKPRTRHTNPKPRKLAAAGNPSPVTSVHHVDSDGIIPPWCSLPYEILLDIFRYASYPLHDENFLRAPSINWLLQTSRICRAFAEPALAALYESPPLLTLDSPHRLLDLLSSNDGHHYLNYGTKIKQLNLDSKQVLSFSSGKRGTFDICALIPFVPQVSVINISNDLDRPPYRSETRSRWVYPSILFGILRDCKIRLEGWRWNGALLGDITPALSDIHSSTSFQSLRRLCLSHVTLLPSDGNSTRRSRTKLGADCLISLSQLSHLTLESCQSETWDFLDYLPRDLTVFNVINCATFNAEALQRFLTNHGSDIQQLTMNHNRSLGLSFLRDLRTSTPNLESLEVDLTYYSATSSPNKADIEPNYDQLLDQDDYPTWPFKLRHLQMLHMRKWSPEVATMFFESLLEAAPSLLYLRSLIIKAMLNISWRERANFREKWISKLQEAFLRNAQPPSHYLATKKAFRESREEPAARPPRRRSGQKQDTEESMSAGVCEIVDISIDNMRPSEVRFSEVDFMDPEVSGDEEWDGGNEVAAPTRYAW